MAGLSDVFSRCFGLVALLRVEQPGLDSERTRAQERRRRAVLSSLALALAKGVAIGTVVITIPLTLSYLGAERYGMWMTISSLIAKIGRAHV